MVKRTLSLMTLLIAVGTVALSGSPTNAEEPTPIALTNEVQNKISGSLWDGEWSSASGGADYAELYLIIGFGHADGGFRINSDTAGYHTYRATGKVKGNTMKLVSGGKNTHISLSLFREKGKLVLKGEYDVVGGEYAGESGTYYFVKKD